VSLHRMIAEKHGAKSDADCTPVSPRQHFGG
jgi:hypothetical protein